MKVALISPYSSITSLGVRLLSACLKEAGQDVKLIFAPAYPKAYTRIRFKDNPYENREDVLRSAWMIRDLPRPARFQLSSLRLYPGTELGAKTRADGLLSKETLEHNFVQRPSYCNLLCSAAVRQPSRWLFRLLTSRPALFLFDRRWLEPIYWLLYKTERTLARARNRQVTQIKGTRP